MMDAGDRPAVRYEVRAAADRQAAIARLAAVEPHACDGSSAADMAEGCALFDLVEDGRTVGAVAIELCGKTATIKAASSEGCCTWPELAMIEQSLRRMGVRHVAMFTRRPGLVRQLLTQGYRLREAELEREL